MLAQRSFQRVDRLGQAIGPLVAPSQGQGNAGVGGTQAGGDFQRPERLPIMLQVAQASPFKKLASNCMLIQSGRLSRI